MHGAMQCFMQTLSQAGAAALAADEQLKRTSVHACQQIRCCSDLHFNGAVGLVSYRHAPRQILALDASQPALLPVPNHLGLNVRHGANMVWMACRR